MKLEPTTVSAKSPPPAFTLAGLRTRNHRHRVVNAEDQSADVPPSGGGLKTVMAAVPAVARSAAEI
jgi:hypothetical protein